MEEQKVTKEVESDLIIELRKLPTMKDVFDFIVRRYPEWIIGFCDNYSDDYPHFYANWKKLSEESNIKPMKVILVKHFENDDQFSLSELLFTAGFVVRTISEIASCPVCKYAIPTKFTYEKLKELNSPNVSLPDEWSEKCKKCQ
jgi:hypothetical protein